MNRQLVVSSLTVLIVLSAIEIFQKTYCSVWTKQPPFPDAYANAWRGDHWPERDTWYAYASADGSTGDMKAYIHSYIDVGGYLNVHFETAMGDFVYVTESGTLFISAVVSLNGHAHLNGICIIFGGFTTAWSLEVWLIVDDMTTGANILNQKANSWEDSDWGAVGKIVDRGTDFNFDYCIPQVSIPVQQGHTYRVRVKFVGWAGVSAYGIAAAQSDIGRNFESETFKMKLKWITYDLRVDSGNGGACPTLFVWNGTDYIEEGILNIHAEADITVQLIIQNTLTLNNGLYKLQLYELDNSSSHIDQVKLYAIDYEGEWHLCPLTYVHHNELGKVTWKLLFDDDNRVDLTPAQTLDLRFLPSIPYGETTLFIFQINGYNAKMP